MTESIECSIIYPRNLLGGDLERELFVLVCFSRDNVFITCVFNPICWASNEKKIIVGSLLKRLNIILGSQAFRNGIDDVLVLKIKRDQIRKVFQVVLVREIVRILRI